MRRTILSWILATALLGGCDAAITEPLESESRPDDAPVLRLILDPTAATIRVGETIHIHATAASADRAAVREIDATWASSDENVATVGADGVVRGHRPGLAIITVYWSNSLAYARIAVLKAESKPLAP